MAVRKTRGRCIYTSFTKTILCAGTMRDLVEILRREIKGIEPGLRTQAEEVFTSVYRGAGYFEGMTMIRPTVRFDGVATADSAGTDFTHFAYIPYDQDIYELDTGSLFVRMGNVRQRLFKLKGIINYGEEDTYLQLKLNETGFENLEAAHG